MVEGKNKHTKDHFIYLKTIIKILHNITYWCPAAYEKIMYYDQVVFVLGKQRWFCI